MGERREAGDVFVADIESFCPQLGKGRIHINGVPQDDGVDDQPERAELVFLTFAVALPQFAALAMEDNAGQLVTALAPVDLGQNPAAIGCVVDLTKHVERLDDPAKLLQRPRETRRPVIGLERSHQPRSLNQAELQRTGQAQKIIPMLCNEGHPHFMRGEIVERAVIGFWIDPPEPGAADIGDARAELVARQPENAEDHVGISARVGHDFGRLKLGFLFEHDAQQHETVAQRARNGDRVEAGKLVGDEVAVGDAALLPKIFRVWPGMNGANRRHEAQTVG